MYCTKCGKQNPDGNKFCEACGAELMAPKVIAPPAPPQAAPTPKREDVLSTRSTEDIRSKPFPAVPRTPQVVESAMESEKKAITQRALIALVGSALMLLGWFLPWFGFGGWGSLAGTILDLVDSGSFLGGIGGNWFGGAALGNGLQLAIFGVLAGLVILFTGGDAALLGLLVLLAIAPFIAILFLAIGCLKQAWVLFRRETMPYVAEHLALEESLLSLLQRVRTVLIIIAVYFVIAAVVPGALAILGRGFYITAVGAGITVAGAQLLRNPIAQLVDRHAVRRRDH